MTVTDNGVKKYTLERPSFTKWTNWAQVQTGTPRHTITPRSEDEVVEIVKYARRHRLPLRPMGGGYSWSPLLPTSGILLDMGQLTGLVSVDASAGVARLRAGTRIKDIGDPLWEAGFSLIQQGAFHEQTIVGAISTGTHGTGISLGNIASCVRGMRIVNGLGEIVELGASDVRELRAARVGLGMLGVILEVDLQVDPRYHLSYDVSYPKWQEVADLWDEDLAANRHFSSMWSPAENSLDAYTVPRPEGLSMIDRTWTVKYNKAEIDEEPGTNWQAVGNRNYRVLSGSDPNLKRFYELEYAVPLERGKEAVQAVQSLMREEHPKHTYPLFLRFVAGDDAYLSPFSHRASVTLSVGSPEGSNYWPFFRDVHDLLTTYDARGHWGKLFLFDRFDIERTYPEPSEFRRVRQEFDPEEVFLNDSLRSLIA